MMYSSTIQRRTTDLASTGGQRQDMPTPVHEHDPSQGLEVHQDAIPSDADGRFALHLRTEQLPQVPQVQVQARQRHRTCRATHMYDYCVKEQRLPSWLDQGRYGKHARVFFHFISKWTVVRHTGEYSVFSSVHILKYMIIASRHTRNLQRINLSRLHRHQPLERSSKLTRVGPASSHPRAANNSRPEHFSSNVGR